MIFGFIGANKAAHVISTKCRVLGVSRSGYHAWATRTPSARSLKDTRLRLRIRELHKLRREVYGAPRIWSDLTIDDGEKISRERVERLRTADLSGLIVRKCRSITVRAPGARVAGASSIATSLNPLGFKIPVEALDGCFATTAT